jgi:hypothetical protein
MTPDPMQNTAILFTLPHLKTKAVYLDKQD